MTAMTTRPPSVPAIAILAATTVLAVTPHLALLPIWYSLLLVTCIAWRLLSAKSMVSPAPALLRLLLTLAVIGLVWAHYGTLIGYSAGTGLLATMLSLKLLETRRYRDVFLAAVLICFLSFSAFLENDSMLMLLYLFGVVTGSISTLLLLRAERSRKLSVAPFVFAIRLVGVSLLPAVLLLYLFPRLPSPLWGLPEPQSARTGISDEMSPGAFTNLIMDDSTAMRVRFQDEVPDAQDLYWRGPVLWDFDGHTWRGLNKEQLESVDMPLLESLSKEIAYEITLIASDRHHLFFLEMPVISDEDVVVTSDYQTLRRARITDNQTYTGRSVVNFRLGASQLQWPVRERALALPRQFNPNSVELAKQWRDQFEDDRELVLNSLNFFHEQPFSYTLNPPSLGRHSTDEFLFETQAGFCEHYASAFVVLMRAAGIPARVVTGYQGGDHIESNDYLLVRQSNAHAWAEVWLQDAGWVRVDPTAAVSPERIESGLMSTTAAPVGWRHARGVRSFRQRLDALQDRWDRWFINYGVRDQENLLARLGLQNYGVKAMIAVLFGLLLALFGTFAWWLLSKSTAAPDRLYKGYAKLLSKLRKAGLHGRDSDTPADWVARLELSKPGQREAAALLQRYQRLRYQPRAGTDELPDWLQQVNKLRLERIVSRTDQSNSRQGR